MSGNEQMMDIETMRNIAELSAKAAAESVATSLRDEIRREFEHFEKRITDKIDSEFKAHFGVLQPSEHVIQHSRLDSFLQWSEDVKKSAWQNLVAGIFKHGITVALMGYFLWKQFIASGGV